MSKKSVGIVGGAGYTGGELIRLLLHHPYAALESVLSQSQAGKAITSVHKDLIGETDLVFTDRFTAFPEILFLCLSHGEAKKWLLANNVPETAKIIDLSQDFRHRENHRFMQRKFVYGLPEKNRDAIRSAKSIANPGCFATSIQLALLPLASRGLLQSDVHISATTGSTGAGMTLSETSHFSWRNNNLSFYKAFSHQHLTEIKETLISMQSDFEAEIPFIPYRGSFTRGILAGIHTKINADLQVLKEIYTTFYSGHPFVHISQENIDLKQVVNTNKCVLYLEKHGDYLLIASAIDNLLKGASGQAVQNMNLLSGWDESTGLTLKPSAF